MWEADPNISNIDKLWCVLEEILGRLAISDIRNCRLVSKKWNYLICSESFVGRVKSQHGIEGKLFIHDRFSAAEGMTLKFEDGETMYTENCGVIDLLYMRSPLILGSVHDLVLIADDENKKHSSFLMRALDSGTELPMKIHMDLKVSMDWDTAKLRLTTK